MRSSHLYSHCSRTSFVTLTSSSAISRVHTNTPACCSRPLDDARAPARHARDGPTKGPAQAPATVQSGERDLTRSPHTLSRCSTAARNASHDLSATRAAAQPSDPPAGAAEVHTGCGGLCAAMADATMSTALAELWLSPRQLCDDDAAADPAARHARPNPAAAAMLRGACSTQMGAPRAHGGSPCRRCSIRVHRWVDGQRPVAGTRFHPVGVGLS